MIIAPAHFALMLSCAGAANGKPRSRNDTFSSSPHTTSATYAVRELGDQVASRLSSERLGPFRLSPSAPYQPPMPKLSSPSRTAGEKPMRAPKLFALLLSSNDSCVVSDSQRLAIQTLKSTRAPGR